MRLRNSNGTFASVPKIKKRCIQCGKTFEIYPSEAKRRNRKFCSRQCYEKSPSIHAPKPKSLETKKSISQTRKRLFAMGMLKNPMLGKSRPDLAYRNKKRAKYQGMPEFLTKFVYRIKVIEELGGKCRVCGLDDCRILEVHHKYERKHRGGEKWIKLYKELDKNKGELELLCPTCHRYLHWHKNFYNRKTRDRILIFHVFNEHAKYRQPVDRIISALHERGLKF